LLKATYNPIFNIEALCVAHDFRLYQLKAMGLQI